MKPVKHICKYCGRAEEYSKKELMIKTIQRTILMFLVVFGMLFLLYFIIIGPNQILTSLLFLEFNQKNQATYDQTRLLTMGMTKGICDGDSSVCFSQAIYANVSNVRYVPTLQTHKTYDPIYVYNNGGACKNTANMFVAMLMSVGVKAKMECNNEHCVSVVPNYWSGQSYPGYMVVDLTIPLAFAMPEGSDLWDYMSEGQIYNWSVRIGGIR